MRHSNAEADIAKILRIFRREQGALSIEKLLEELGDNISRRTMQRRLAEMVEKGELVAQGEKRGVRYALPSSQDMAQKTKYAPESGAFRSGRVVQPGVVRVREDFVLTVSADAEDIRRNVTRSLAVRKPVGYRGEFLGAYEPNVTAYLRAEDREKLAAMGKVETGRQPAGTYFRKVLDRLLIDLSWNSSRLEGNTYSLLETERLLEQGQSAEGKDASDAQMILNHKAAIELLAEQPEEIGFNRYTLFNLHALLSDGLLPDPRAGGRLRDRPVGISGTVYHPLEVPQRIDEYFHEFLGKASAIEDAYEQSFFAMVHLPYLQPFVDVNKRVSRLAANIPLVKRNLCPLSFVDVPQADYVSAILGVYELNRVEYLRDVYVWAYERSCGRYSSIRQSLGEPDAFRMRYRSQLQELVRGVVTGRMTKAAASRWIAKEAGQLVPEADRAKFVEMVETELSSLHEGNMARYRVRPAEFEAWGRRWGGAAGVDG